tara:strand:+ start:145 stop:345 length:201 start_codon:yes stop_codon:yes gene_type:complete
MHRIQILQIEQDAERDEDINAIINSITSQWTRHDMDEEDIELLRTKLIELHALGSLHGMRMSEECH